MNGCQGTLAFQAFGRRIRNVKHVRITNHLLPMLVMGKRDTMVLSSIHLACNEEQMVCFATFSEQKTYKARWGQPAGSNIPQVQILDADTIELV